MPSSTLKISPNKQITLLALDHERLLELMAQDDSFFFQKINFAIYAEPTTRELEAITLTNNLFERYLIRHLNTNLSINLNNVHLVDGKKLSTYLRKDYLESYYMTQMNNAYVARHKNFGTFVGNVLHELAHLYGYARYEYLDNCENNCETLACLAHGLSKFEKPLYQPKIIYYEGLSEAVAELFSHHVLNYYAVELKRKLNLTENEFNHTKFFRHFEHCDLLFKLLEVKSKSFSFKTLIDAYLDGNTELAIAILCANNHETTIIKNLSLNKKEATMAINDLGLKDDIPSASQSASQKTKPLI